MVDINNIELQNMTFNGQEVNTWIHNGVEVFCAIAENSVAFSADVSLTDGYSHTQGFKESNRFIDNTLFIEVTQPITNVVWSVKDHSNPSNTITKKAYTPTQKALRNYRYAIVDLVTSIAYWNGGGDVIFGGIALNKLPSNNGGVAFLKQTIILELNDNTDIYSYAKNIMTSTNTSSFVSAANVAIEKIVLINGENPSQVELIPTLSSTTGSNGVALYSSQLSADYAIYKAFDNNYSTAAGTSTSSNPYIGYQFNTPIYTNKVSVDLAYTHGVGTNYTLNFKLQYLYNGVWTDIPNTSKTDSFVGASTWTEKHYEWNFDTIVTNAIRLIEYSGNSWAMLVRTMQIYGEEI